MPRLMRCLYCGLLQDEPPGMKVCAHCGGELVFEQPLAKRAYVRAQMELDQVEAPADQIAERHLIVTVETPPEVPPDEAAPTAAGRDPLSFVAVLDTSGSMRGPKLDAAKEAVRQALRLLREGDTFALVTFASRVATEMAPQTVARGLRQAADEVLTRVRAGGNTALCGGLDAGLAAARLGQRATNLVLLLSDGQANEGETDLEKIGARALSAREEGVTTSTLGVGQDYNEALMVEVATQGGGRFYHVLQPHQIAPYVAGELGEASALAALQTRLGLTVPPGSGVLPFSAAYPVSEGPVISLGDIPVDTQLEVVLRLLLPAQPSGARLPIEGRLTFQSPAGNTHETALNVVTLRYEPEAKWDRRNGAVRPVVERVLEQMRARSVLGTVRAAALHGQEAGVAEGRLTVAALRDYASLLGEEQAENVAHEQNVLYASMARAPLTTKAAVDRAFRTQKSTKDFDK